MVTDHQVRRYFKLMHTEKNKAIAAAKSGMDSKTARRYEKLGKLPSEVKGSHTWRTRKDPFSEVWAELKELLEVNQGLEAKTLFEYLQREYPGKYTDGQLRTLQRKVKTWRALHGKPKEVYFEQVHHPGEACQSDFTDMNDLNVSINHQRFDHLIYHFVLPYSNWETGTICFSESFESLSTGMQNALWELGGVPQIHQTDRLSAAVVNTRSTDEFTRRYQGLLDYYRLKGRKIQAGKAHENGDIEQRHYRFKKALAQALMLRGSRNFSDREAYAQFLKKLFNRLNTNRKERLCEELDKLKRLPSDRLDTCKPLDIKVGQGSTIRLNRNVYSVNSCLIGEKVSVRLYADFLEVWYAQRCVEKIPRLRGKGNHYIQYRHIIDWLLRKPGAFKNYRYHHDLFPTHYFRIAYDQLTRRTPGRADKEYLRILHLAAKESETAVNQALTFLINRPGKICYESVERIVKQALKLPDIKVVAIVKQALKLPDIKVVAIDRVNLGVYDALLSDSMLMHSEERQVI